MRRFTRRHFASLLGAALPLAALAGDSALPVPASLRHAARDANAKGTPLVLLASLPGCPYCELVRRNYLLPMRAEGLHAWQINVTDRKQAIAGFFGESTTGAALAARWKATFTPTVLFFDAQGTELAERLVGVASPDFYGSYLDEAVLAAGKKLASRR